MSCGKLPTVKGRLSIIISGCPRFYDVRVLTDLPYRIANLISGVHALCFFIKATDHATKKPSLLILVCICTHLSIDFCFKTGPKFQIYSRLNSYIPSNYIFRKPCVIDLHASQSVDMMNLCSYVLLRVV